MIGVSRDNSQEVSLLKKGNNHDVRVFAIFLVFIFSVFSFRKGICLWLIFWARELERIQSCIFFFKDAYQCKSCKTEINIINAHVAEGHRK